MRRLHFLCLLLPVLLLAGCSGVTIDLPGRAPEAVTPEVVPLKEPVPEPDPEPTREVLFFTQEGCPPCERAKPRVEELRRQGLKVTEIDVRERPDLVRQYRITQTPTFVILQDGVEIERTGDIVLLITILVKVLAWALPFLLG